MVLREPTISWFSLLVYRTLCALSDAVDTLLLVLYPDTTPPISLSPSKADTLSDEEVRNAYKDSEFLGPGVYLMEPPAVMKLAADIENDGHVSEVDALNMLISKTKIPVPRPRKVFEFQKQEYMFIMDYIKGQTLDKVWPTCSLWTKIRVAFILRRYIRQLRGLQAPPGTPPGPLSNAPARPRICYCASIFGQIRPMRGPFASYAELSAFWNKMHEVLVIDAQLPVDDPFRKQRFDDSSPLVFCHMDLNPRNIMLGEDGRVWLIHWAWAGYYPAWFEYIAMQERVDNEMNIGFKDSSWEAIIPFVCDPYVKQEKWYWEVQCSLRYTFAK